jgi:aryl-alcohol dehydrogenase-like predicted oxidoreductase
MEQGDDIIPIPGTTSTTNFDENMGSLKVKLSADEEKEIRKLVEEAETVGERYPPG